jgi:protein CpxP
MTTPTTTLSCLAALLIVTVPLVTAPATAQPAPPAPPATTVSAQSQVQAATEQRISGLQTQLAVTAAQMPQWNAFAQVMRDNAQSTDALFRQRAAGVQSMNAVANMQSYAQISRAYADGAEKLAASLGTLYGTLSDPQKQAADTLFQQQAANAAKPQAKAR